MPRAPPERPAMTTADSAPAPPKPSAKKTRSITFVDYSPAVDASDKKRRRQDVRKHAATASAAARKATIARRAAIRLEQANLFHHYHRHPHAWYVPTDGSGVGGEHVASTAVMVVHPDGSHAPWMVVPAAAPLAIRPPAPHSDPFQRLVQYVTELQGDRVWYLGPVERTSLAHKAMRSTLMDAMTNSTTLFQAALFVAGTHSNTCGLPSHSAHLGVGMILLRGASLGAIQSSIVAAASPSSSGDEAPEASPDSTLLPVAIAMLAGWERRFGDPQAFEVHMQAWRSLALPAPALDPNHVSTLTDLVLESFRENLDERADASLGAQFRLSSPSPPPPAPAVSLLSPPSSTPSSTSSPSPPPLPSLFSHSSQASLWLPPGFSPFHLSRPESRSLLAMASQLLALSPSSPHAIPTLRRLGLENMAWSPTHTASVAPRPDLEESWWGTLALPPSSSSSSHHPFSDPSPDLSSQPTNPPRPSGWEGRDQPDILELHALYHVRAALIPVGGLLLAHAMALRRIPWRWDLRGALGVHTVSCQHLSTDRLMGSRFAGVAVWTRFLLCAVHRDPPRDQALREWVRGLGIRDWEGLRGLMERFWFDEELIGRECRELFGILMGGEKGKDGNAEGGEGEGMVGRDEGLE